MRGRKRERKCGTRWPLLRSQRHSLRDNSTQSHAGNLETENSPSPAHLEPRCSYSTYLRTYVVAHLYSSMRYPCVRSSAASPLRKFKQKLYIPIPGIVSWKGAVTVHQQPTDSKWVVMNNGGFASPHGHPCESADVDDALKWPQVLSRPKRPPRDLNAECGGGAQEMRNER